MQGQKHWELALELDRANTLLSPSLPRLLLCCFTSFPCNLHNNDPQIKLYFFLFYHGFYKRKPNLY